MQLNKQLEDVKGLLTDTITQLAEKDLELKGLKADRTVDEYKAETDRLRGTAAAAKDIGDLSPMLPVIVQAVSQALAQKWPPQQVEQEVEPMASDTSQDLPPLNDLPWDVRSHVDASLSNGNPNG